MVTSNLDTIRIINPIVVADADYTRWKSITVEDVLYPMEKVHSLFLDNQHYRTIQGRLWKRVIAGNINIYALRDTDTLTDSQGKLVKKLWMSLGAQGKLLPYTYRNFVSIIKDHPALKTELVANSMQGHGGVALVVVGVGVMAVSLVGVVIGSLVYLIDGSEEELNNLFALCGSGFVLGAGSVTGGVLLNHKSKKINLAPVHHYNIHNR